MSDKPAWLASMADFEQGLGRSTDHYFVGLASGTMELGLYRPDGLDPQNPHKQDEIYIIRTGTADFLRDNERISVSVGDTLFVPAGMEHRFVNFSDDFDTWVVFWGPEGGED